MGLCLDPWTLKMVMLSQLTCCISTPNMAWFIKLDEMPCGKKWLTYSSSKRKPFLFAQTGSHTTVPQGLSTQWTLADQRYCLSDDGDVTCKFISCALFTLL